MLTWIMFLKFLDDMEQINEQKAVIRGKKFHPAIEPPYLDIKNPRGRVDFEHLPPEQLADDILKKEQRIAEIMMEIKQILAHQ